MSNPNADIPVGVVHLLKGRWKALLLGMGVATLLGLLVAFTKEPTYRAEITLMPISKVSDLGDIAGLGALGGLAQMTGLLSGSTSSVNEARAILTSRRFVEQFVSRNLLMTELFETRWDSAQKTWKYTWLKSKPPSEFDAYRKIRDEVVSIVEDSRGGVLYLRVDWKDPAKASHWANLLVETLNDEMRLREAKESEELLDLLLAEYSRAASSEVRQSLARSIEQTTKRKAMTSVTRDFAFKVIDPARPSESKDFISPNRVLYLLISPFIGLFLVIGVIHLKGLLSRGAEVDR